MLVALNNFRHYLVSTVTGLLCCFCLSANAQYFTLAAGRSKTISFSLVRDLVVIKLKINNKGPYNFILDTGVGFMLITEPSVLDGMDIITKRKINIIGLGDGEPIEAYISAPLLIDIDGLTSNNVSAAVFKEDALGLSSYCGIKIHGLLGYDFFSRLAVKISFSDTTIQVAEPQNMRFYKRGVKLPITIEDKKPYLTTKVVFADGSQKQSKFIIDLGAGHYLSMENVSDKSIIQKNAISANLGMSINGFINGTISRIKELDIGKYKLKNVITAFPEDDGRLKNLNVPRDGNLGIGVLKKFDVIFNYPDSVIYLKPSLAFNRKDEHDMSGLVYFADIKDDLQHIIIFKVEPNSAGEEAGLLPNDEIVGINFRPVSSLSLQQIDNLFKSADGRTFILGVFRDKKYINVMLILKRRL